jgi:hypothetical protein
LDLEPRITMLVRARGNLAIRQSVKLVSCERDSPAGKDVNMEAEEYPLLGAAT